MSKIFRIVLCVTSKLLESGIWASIPYSVLALCRESFSVLRVAAWAIASRNTSAVILGVDNLIAPGLLFSHVLSLFVLFCFSYKNEWETGKRQIGKVHQVFNDIPRFTRFSQCPYYTAMCVLDFIVYVPSELSWVARNKEWEDLNFSDEEWSSIDDKPFQLM